MQERLKESFVIRNKLSACDSVSEIAAEAVRIVREKLESQTASIFLFNKFGKLYRFSTVGIDAAGHEISSDWFPDEVCDPDESFTFKAVKPDGDSKFGSPQVTNDLGSYHLPERVRSIYESKLGSLKCAAAIPLNGANRTFGVLEVVNRAPGATNRHAEFALDELFWLSLIGTSVASTISILGRRREAAILAMLGEWISKLADSNFHRDVAYLKVAESLVDRLQPYRACIIRIADESGYLRVAAKAGDEVSWEGWSNEHPNAPGSVTRDVFESGDALFYSNIDPLRIELTNMQWMDDNQLVAFTCLPLKHGPRSVGTISLYVSYEYDFSANVRTYLGNVASLILAYAECCRIVDENAEILEERANFARVTVMNEASEEVTRSRHDLKNRLIEIKTSLTESQQAGTKRKSSIEGLIRKLGQQIDQLESSLTQSADTQAVDVNAVIEESIRQLERRPQKNRVIRIVPSLSPEVRPIMAVREEIQDMTTNLIHNSIRAIEHSRERNGLIEVSTRMVRDRHNVEFVEIAVSDNGCGIPNENRRKVYERGFSTYDSGTGVGLFTTRNTVKRYGGRIEFDSSFGRGTTFRVRLPWATLAAERRARNGQNEGQESAYGSR